MTYYAIEFSVVCEDTDFLSALIAASPLEVDPDVWAVEYVEPIIHQDLQGRECIVGSFRFLESAKRAAFLDNLLNMPPYIHLNPLFCYLWLLF